ncbi:OmpA/MotB family protein [Desulforapulum autotrophicum]|nr:OmpA family protein [Desulforapulum autotrophicum]
MRKVTLLKTLICFIILMPFNVQAEPVSSSDSSDAFKLVERDSILDLVKSYETELDLTDKDILNFKMEREWLYLKISTIQDQNRLPPEVLKASRSALNQKIMTAQARKKQLMELIQIHGRDIEQLNKMIDHAGGSDLSYPSKTAKSRSRGMPPSGVEKALEESLIQAGLENHFEVAVEGPGLVLESVFPILFDPCKFALTDAHKRFLGRLAGFLKPYSVLVEVTGFTDYRKIRGTKMTNIELSAKRAGAVVRELRERGMKSSVFKITGMGEYKKCLEKSERCRVLSRRADITIHFVQE